MQFENQLIEAIKRHDSLYNSNKKEFHNIFHKEKIWNEISHDIDVPVNLCRTRWRSLRNGFVREHKHIKNHVGFKSNWQYYDDLLFLADFVRTRRSHNYSKFTSTVDTYNGKGKLIALTLEEDLSSESVDTESGTPLTKQKQQSNSTSNINQNALLPSYVDEELDNDFDVEENSDSFSDSNQTSINSTKRKLSNRETSQESSSIITLMEDIRADFAKFLENNTRIIENEIASDTDEIDEFLKLVKRKFLKLPEDVANAKQLEILSILNKAIAENIN